LQLHCFSPENVEWILLIAESEKSIDIEDKRMVAGSHAAFGLGRAWIP
jgi:hypothetical protein